MMVAGWVITLGQSLGSLEQAQTSPMAQGRPLVVGVAGSVCVAGVHPGSAGQSGWEVETTGETTGETKNETER